MHRVATTACIALILCAPAFGGVAEDLEILVSPDGLATGDYDSVMDDFAGVIERNAKLNVPVVRFAVTRLNVARMWAKDPDRVTDRLLRVVREGVVEGENDEELRRYLWNRLRERGESAAAEALAPDRAYLRNWAVVGPFGANTRSELFRRFGPEQGVDFKRSYKDAGEDRRFMLLPPSHGYWMEPDDILRPTNGTMYAVAQVKSEKARDVWLGFVSSGSGRVWLNGEEVITVDRLRNRLTRIQRVGARLRAGWNRFLVKLPGRSTRFAMWLSEPGLARPIEAVEVEKDLVLHDIAPAPEGDTGQAPPVKWRAPEDSLPAEAAGPYLDAARGIFYARNDLDIEAVEAMKKAAAAKPDDPALHYYLGYYLERTRELPEVHRKNRAKKAYVVALELVPGYVPAAIRLANLHHADDRSEEGARLLRDLLDKNPGCIQAHMALGKICSARGWEKEAVAEAEAALVLGPRNDAALLFLAGHYEKYGDLPRTRELLERLLKAESNNYDVLRRLAKMDLNAGDVAGAAAHYRRMGEFWPLYTGYRLNLANIALDAGRNDEALEHLRQVADRFPLEPNYPDRIGDALRRIGDKAGAVESYEKSLALGPWQSGLRRYVARLKDEPTDFSLPWEVDALDLIEGLPGREEYPRSPAICILDSQVTRVWPDGSSSEIVHQAYKLLDEKGVEAFGRVNTGGETLEIRTIDKDGEIFEPINVRQNSFNMPALAPGVIVDYRYRADTRRSPRVLDTGNFFFADPEFDKAVLLSRWVIILPKELKIDLILRKFDGKHEVKEEGDTIVHLLEMENEPRVEKERYMPDNTELLPRARLVHNRPFSDLGFLYADRVWGGLSPTPLVEREAAKVTQGIEGSIAKARRIFAHVNEIITGSSSYGSPTATLIQKSGNRFRLFLSMLIAAGVDFEMAMAGFNRGRDIPWEFVETGMFRRSCARIPGENGEVVWAFSGSRFAPFARIPTSYLDSPVMVLSEEGGRIETLPSGREEDHQNLSVTTIELTKEATETTGSIRLVQPTDGGYSMKERLRNSDNDDRRQMVERMASSVFTGPKLVAWELPELETLGSTPVITAELGLPNFLRAENGGVSCGLGFSPTDLKSRYVGKTERIHPMKIPSDYGWRDEVEIWLGGRQVTSLPDDHVTMGPLGAYSLTLRQDGDSIRVVRNARFRPVTLSPAEYNDFVKWLKAIDEAELRRIELSD